MKKIIENSLAYATILKLNDEELPIVGKIFGLDGNSKILINKIIDKFNLEIVALTRGAEGSLLISKNDISE